MLLNGWVSGSRIAVGLFISGDLMFLCDGYGYVFSAEKYPLPGCRDKKTTCRKELTSDFICLQDVMSINTYFGPTQEQSGYLCRIFET